MAEPAVLQATFADWRTVKGRKQLQLIFEVPIEQQAHVLSVLGAPLGDSATWVAIARLQAPTAPPERALEPPPKGRNPDAADRARAAYHADNEMGKAARLAGMLRKDREYQTWLIGRQWGTESEKDYAELTAQRQRQLLCVKSCSAIATDPDAYQRWQAHLLAFEQATGRAARPS